MQTYTVTFENISQHKLIQDKSKLNVGALIIKKVTNGNQIKTTIENAAKCRVESGETGIKQVDNGGANVVTGSTRSTDSASTLRLRALLSCATPWYDTQSAQIELK